MGFWIHGGGWQTGDKSGARQAEGSHGRGLDFVSINHRFLPTVEMGAITRDVASALGWVHRDAIEPINSGGSRFDNAVS